MKDRDQVRPRGGITGSVSRMLAVVILLRGLVACGGMQIPKAQIASPAQSLFNGQVRADILALANQYGADPPETRDWLGSNSK